LTGLQKGFFDSCATELAGADEGIQTMTIAAQSEQARTGRLLLFLAFGNFVIGMGIFTVIGSISPIAEGLGASEADTGVVVTTFALAYALLAPAAAALTGMIARRLVLVAGMSIFCVSAVLSALSTSILMLASIRVLVALGVAMYMPIAAGVAVAISPPQQRGKALATVFGGITLAQIFGTPFGSWVSYRFGWEAGFWTVAILAAVSAAVVFVTIPRDVTFQANKIGAIIDVLKDFRMMFAVAVTCTLLVALYTVFTFLAPLIQASAGDNPEVRTWYLALYGIAGVAGNWIGGRLSDRIGGRRTLVIICIAQAVLMPTFSIIPWGPVPFSILIVTWSIFSWSLVTPQQARLTLIAPQAISIVLALNGAMNYVGVAIGSAIGSYLLAWKGLASLGIAGGILVLLALVHLLASGRPRPHDAVQRPL
jgi:DHA1 family inner membrane transport protein